MIKTRKDHKSAFNQYVLWHLSDTRKTSSSENSLPRESHCLREEIDTPDLTTLKGVFRFYIATNYGNIEEKPISDSVNAFAE